MAQLGIKLKGAVKIQKSLNRASNTILTHSNIMVWFNKFADPYMRRQFRKSFETITSPKGKRWKGAFVDGQETTKRVTLRKTGGLMRSVTQKRGNARISAGFGQRNIEMVWGHKDGGGNIRLRLTNKIDKFKIHQVGSKGGKIKARPMIGFRRGDSTHLGRSLSAFITNQMRRI